MRIGIVTLPLHYNYGGILQNWALQQVLIKLGHHPMTIDAYVRYPYFLYYVKKCFNLFLRIFGKHTPVLSKPYKGRSTDKLLGDFITRHINLTKPVNEYNTRLIKKYKFEAIIVGSDQIWRPKYNKRIETVFLDFLREENIRRIGYSVSFGCEEWEYTNEQTTNCRHLISLFDAVSSREESGVLFIKNKLEFPAIITLDPTLLLSSQDYLNLCIREPITNDRFIAVYCLDPTDSFLDECKVLAEKLSLPLKVFGADGNCSLSVPQWIAIFRDASRIITDSYHGSIFSLLFKKPVKILNNSNRGQSRFKTLLSLYKFKKDEYGFLEIEDNSRIIQLRSDSLTFLKRHCNECNG